MSLRMAAAGAVLYGAFLLVMYLLTGRLPNAVDAFNLVCLGIIALLIIADSIGQWRYKRKYGRHRLSPKHRKNEHLPQRDRPLTHCCQRVSSENF